MRVDPFRKPSWPKAYSFALVTVVLFVGSWAAQFVFQAVEFAGEAGEHGGRFEWGAYWPAFLAATFENWQSEFLQACWTVVGLGLFYQWGSAQSREQTERIEAKLDQLLEMRRISGG
jgi:hypothetical protein